MLLQNILSGRETSKFTAIWDTAFHSGQALLKCLVKAQLSRVDCVVVILLDISVTDFLHGFQEEEKNRLICHDFYSDLSNWDHQRDSEVNGLQDIFSRIKESIKDKGRTSVVINSLSHLLLEYPIHEVHHGLQGILSATSGQQHSELVVLLHADLHTQFVLNFSRYLSSTVLEVHTKDHTSQAQASGICFVTHRKKSGKVVRKKQPYSVSLELELVQYPEEEWTVAPTRVPEDQDQGMDPTASLTFNLSLSDKEKQARESVRLPYMLDSQTKTNILQPSKETGASQIFYTPDDVDDFDEDDPDDDLDI